MTRRTRPRLVGTIDGGDLYAVIAGGAVVLAVLPALEDAMPGPLKESISRRRATLLEGLCPCGVRLDLDRVVAATLAGKRYGAEAALASLDVEHADGCPAPDAQRLLSSWETTRRGEE